MSFPRSRGRIVLVSILLTLAVGLVALQVADLQAAPLAPTQVPTASSLGSCVFHGTFVCDLCRPCPENCIQACSPELCECKCVGCILEGGA